MGQTNNMNNETIESKDTQVVKDRNDSLWSKKNDYNEIGKTWKKIKDLLILPIDQETRIVLNKEKEKLDLEAKGLLKEIDDLDKIANKDINDIIKSLKEDMEKKGFTLKFNEDTHKGLKFRYISKNNTYVDIKIKKSEWG